MIMIVKDVIAYCLVVSLGIILAIHFALFWVYGGVFIYESNKAILLIETIMSIAILGLGIERLLSVAKTRRDREVSSIGYTKGQEQPSFERVTLPGPLQAGEHTIASAIKATTETLIMSGVPIDSSADQKENCAFKGSSRSNIDQYMLHHPAHARS